MHVPHDWCSHKLQGWDAHFKLLSRTMSGGWNLPTSRTGVLHTFLVSSFPSHLVLEIQEKVLPLWWPEFQRRNLHTFLPHLRPDSHMAKGSTVATQAPLGLFGLTHGLIERVVMHFVHFTHGIVFLSSFSSSTLFPTRQGRQTSPLHTQHMLSSGHSRWLRHTENGSVPQPDVYGTGGMMMK